MKTHLLAVLIVYSVVVISLTESRGVELSELCTTALYSDQELTTRVEQISVYEKVFLELSCEILVPGDYVFTTQWMDTTGRLQAERQHQVLLGFPRPYAAVFKFKQMPQGSLKKMSSGDDFETHQYGQWSVLSFINGEEIDRIYFTITE